MIHEHRDDRFVPHIPSATEPKHTEPHTGHGGTAFEGTDAAASIVIWSLSIIGGILVIVFAMTIGIQKILEVKNPRGDLPSPLAPARVIPQGPLLQVRPWEELPELRAHEDQVLNSYGKDPDGHAHVPINVAMDAVVPRLNIAPNAQQGITTPGGEGREFSGSINSLPPAYRRPQIQGEIRKSGQK